MHGDGAERGAIANVAVVYISAFDVVKLVDIDNREWV
jgi:hypothetical protein